MPTLTDRVPDVLNKWHPKVAHLRMLSTLFDGTDQDSYTAADLTAGKGTLITAIDGVIDGAGTDEEKKTAIAALINGEAHIADTITASKKSVFDAAKGEMIVAINAYQEEGAQYLNYSCPRCGEKGEYPAKNDSYEDPANDTLKICDSCKGLGRLPVENKGTTKWSGELPDRDGTE